MNNELNLALAAKFAERSGYQVSDSALLVGALTHPSYTGHEAEDYQRLEFLGDRVLGLVMAEDLYRRFPDAREGDLAHQFNYLVRKQTCAAAARAIDLGALVRSQDLAANVSVVSMRILGDACEAVIAAVYLDGGFDAVRSFILQLWQPFLSEAETAARDAKTLLQEWSLGLGIGIPDYKVVSRSGPDHAPVFEITVRLPDHAPHTGKASSKRKAEQLAAQAFIDANEIDIE